MDTWLTPKTKLWISSAAGVVIARTATAPLDRVKVLLQIHPELVRSGRIEKPIAGITDCILRVYKAEGARGFWRGALPNVLRWFPPQAITFACHGALRHVIPHNDSVSNFARAAIYGAIALVVCYPLDYAHTRLTADLKPAGPSRHQFAGMRDVWRATLRTDGVVGIYRGATASFLGTIVHRWLYFGALDAFNLRSFQRDKNPAAMFFLTLALSVSCSLVVYPFDTVRRRMMMRSCEAVKYKSFIHAFGEIISKERPMALFRGASVSVISSTGTALLLLGAGWLSP